MGPSSTFQKCNYSPFILLYQLSNYWTFPLFLDLLSLFLLTYFCGTYACGNGKICVCVESSQALEIT